MTKDQLRHRNIMIEYVDSDNPQNTTLLEHYLFKDNQDELIVTDPRYIEHNNQSIAQELLDCIIVEQPASHGRQRQ